MDGFVTLAVGDGYLQRAAAFALSARRFGFPTILMHRDVDPGPYRSLFAEITNLTDEATVNRAGAGAARELKKCAYRRSESFQRCAFVDADSLVIRDPRAMFDLLARDQVHTPCARDLRVDEHWNTGRMTTRAVACAMGVPDTRPLPTLNGGFFIWERGETAQRVLREYHSLFDRLSAYFLESESAPSSVSDELCLAISIALHNMPRHKSDSSIGIWDAAQLVLDIERQEFECTKHYYWEGHRFRPYIAHFGGSTISPLYRRCVEFLRRGSPWPFLVFDPTAPEVVPVRSGPYSPSARELNALAEFARRNNVRTVLEFGPGRSTEYFLNAGCEVWSFEYQERWLRHCRRTFAGRPRLTLGRFENVPDVRLPELVGRRFDMAFVDSPTAAHRPVAVPQSRLNTTLAAARYSDVILLHDVDRVHITEVSREPTDGTITIDVRGKSATPPNKPDGDTKIEAKLDGNVCGSAQVIVIVPKRICGPCPPGSSSSSRSSSSSGGACPPGSERTPENVVMDATTSPAYWGPLGPNQVKLATVWIQWMTIQVCDQFGDSLDAMYSGCCVEEFVVEDGKWHSINQTIDDEGTYQDPVFRLAQPTPAIVDRDSQAAQDWPTDPTLPMQPAGSEPQSIPVRICGHTVGRVVRKVYWRPPNCVWIVCRDGTIIVE